MKVLTHSALLVILVAGLTPAQNGWASVCYGLVRHPEFHLY